MTQIALISFGSQVLQTWLCSVDILLLSPLQAVVLPGAGPPG